MTPDEDDLDRAALAANSDFREWVAMDHVTAPVERRIFHAMHSRCKNVRGESYKNYGGRGIKVCARWRYFELFYADMGPRPSSGHSIDRINNDGNYEPGNCRWATRIEQNNNRRPRTKKAA